MTKKLDSMFETLDKLESLQSERIKTFQRELDTQRHALHQVHLSVESSVRGLAELVKSANPAKEDAEKSGQEGGQRDWLGQVSGQLVASGITSAMTGSVVTLATQSGSLTSSATAQRLAYPSVMRALTHCHFRKHDYSPLGISSVTATAHETTRKKEDASKTEEVRSASGSMTSVQSQKFEIVWNSTYRPQGTSGSGAAAPPKNRDVRLCTRPKLAQPRTTQRTSCSSASRKSVVVRHGYQSMSASDPKPTDSDEISILFWGWSATRLSRLCQSSLYYT